MRFCILTTLIAVAAASPLGDQVLARSPSPSPTCTSMSTTTTTVGTASPTLTGPFELIANAPGLPQDGYFAHAGAPSIYTTIIYDVSPLRRVTGDTNATTFFVNEHGNLITIQDGLIYFANVVTPYYDGNIDDSNVVISSDADVVNKAVCKIDADSCAMNCTVGDSAYNCLADPTYQPDWRLTKEKKGSGGGCVVFNPVVVPS